MKYSKQTSPEPMSRRRFLQVSGRYLQLFAAMSAVGAITNFPQAGASSLLTGSKKHRFLEDLQRRQLSYFIDNQTESGLMLDRQHNHAAPDLNGIISTAATGMGLIAVALAAQPEYRMITRADAVSRVEKALRTAENLPQQHGIMPHFLDSKMKVLGSDHFSTIDSSWLIAGALASAQILQDTKLESLAEALYNRVDWRYWANDPAGECLLFMGQTEDGSFIGKRWNRLNAETAFMYLMAFGAQPNLALQKQVLQGLIPMSDEEFKDMGLFVSQYSNCLFDGRYLLKAMGLNMEQIEHNQTLYNRHVCQSLGKVYETYADKLWGLSAGDGPGPSGDVYRVYSPTTADGTAHVTASLASIEVASESVLDNVMLAAKLRLGPDKLEPLGKYGFSNINVDRRWISRDVVGIDIGASIMSVDNYLNHDRVKQAFLRLDFVDRASGVLAGKTVRTGN
jgi:hypothetical protein